jgi:hypothetical protein
MVAERPADASHGSAGRIVPLFRPYRLQVSAVIVLIVVTSTIGIINPLLIQAVFNKALFVPGGPDLHLLYVLVGVMALVPVVNGAIGILQTYETTRVGQQVMRDLRNRLYSHLETLTAFLFTNTKTGEIRSRLANDVGGVETVVTSTASTILANVVTFVRHCGRRARVPAVGREAAPGHRPRPAARPADPDLGRGDVGPGHRQRTGGAESAGRPDGLADDDCHRSPAVHHRQRGQHLCHRRRPGRGIRLAPRSAARGRAVRVAV